jgi:3-dehydroquinate dehydratase-2
MLGKREASIYGAKTYESLCADITDEAGKLGVCVRIAQSNHEGELVDAIHAAQGESDCIIINPAAFTHTSVAIRDALLAVSIPVIEVHISNIFSREEFRHHSFVSGIARAVLTGFGTEGYRMALDYAAKNV